MREVKKASREDEKQLVREQVGFREICKLEIRTVRAVLVSSCLCGLVLWQCYMKEMVIERALLTCFIMRQR